MHQRAAAAELGAGQRTGGLYTRCRRREHPQEPRPGVALLHLFEPRLDLLTRAFREAGIHTLADARLLASLARKSSRAAEIGSALQQRVRDAAREVEAHVAALEKRKRLGQTVGPSRIDAAERRRVALARQHHGPVLVEEYIAGTEVFVGIVDGEVLGSVEVRPATKFYDYEAKYLRNDTQYLLPPELPADVLARCEAHALAAYKALGCSGHSRPDLRINRAGDAFVLEVNTLPGMTATSLLPKIAKRAGLTYAQLCERILVSAR